VRYLPGAGPAEIAKALADADVAAQLASGDVVVVAGRGNLAESHAAAVAALGAVLDAVPNARVLPALRRGNVVGALQLGLAPSDAEHDALATLQAAADGKVDLLVLLGCDPINDCPDANLARRALTGARRIIAIDAFLSDSTSQADLVLAAAAFGEQDGTTTNLEGRVSPVSQAVTPHGTSRPDWMIATELALMLGRDIGFDSVASAQADVVAVSASFSPLVRATPTVTPPNSYDYRLVVSRKLYDNAVSTRMSPSLAPLAIGAGAHVHPLDLERVGVSEGTDVKLVGARGSVVLPLIADETVQRGTIWAPFNQEGADITELVDADAPITDVRIERL
jgi:NADH-quinone oxidoreductase subunit G